MQKKSSDNDIAVNVIIIAVNVMFGTVDHGMFNFCGTCQRAPRRLCSPAVGWNQAMKAQR